MFPIIAYYCSRGFVVLLIVSRMLWNPFIVSLGLFNNYATPTGWVVLIETDLAVGCADLSVWRFNTFFVIQSVALGDGWLIDRKFRVT